MRQAIVFWAVVVLVCVVVTASVRNVFYYGDLEGQLASIEELLTEEEVSEISTTWNTKKGSKTVTTKQESGEDWATTVARHEREVDEAQRTCPKID